MHTNRGLEVSLACKVIGLKGVCNSTDFMEVGNCHAEDEGSIIVVETQEARMDQLEVGMIL
jgi:hypothetical protein